MNAQVIGSIKQKSEPRHKKAARYTRRKDGLLCYTLIMFLTQKGKQQSKKYVLVAGFGSCLVRAVHRVWGGGGV